MTMIELCEDQNPTPLVSSSVHIASKGQSTHKDFQQDKNIYTMKY